MSQNEPVMSQRARFEAWAVKPPREWCVIRQGERNIWPDQYCDYHVQCAWESWQAACPEGWSAVPIKPVQQQIDSVFWAHEDADVYGIYADMVANAPKPE